MSDAEADGAPHDASTAVGGRRRLQIERLVAGGDALARDRDGRVVFVEHALPGESVEVEFVEVKRDLSLIHI